MTPPNPKIALLKKFYQKVNPTKAETIKHLKLAIEVFGYASLSHGESDRLSIDGRELASKNGWGYILSSYNHNFTKERPHLTFGEKPNKKDLKRIKKMRAHN